MMTLLSRHQNHVTTILICTYGFFLMLIMLQIHVTTDTRSFVFRQFHMTMFALKKFVMRGITWRVYSGWMLKSFSFFPRYDPQSAFELTLQWSVATGSIITDLVIMLTCLCSICFKMPFLLSACFCIFVIINVLWLDQTSDMNDNVTAYSQCVAMP